MPSFPFSAVALAACFALPTLALELNELSLPLTRSQADAAFSKDYSFRVLEDLTVRRSWKLENRKVSIDFSPKEEDKALLIFIDYTRPVSPELASEDAEQMMGASIAKWSPVNPQRAAKLGMAVAEGVKQEGGRFCFRELDAQGRVVRLAYYASVPKSVRWNLADDARESGRTAMGSRTVGGSSEFLWKDEERRRGVKVGKAASSSSPDAPVSLDDAAAAAVAEDLTVKPAPMKHPRVVLPSEDEGAMAVLKEWAAKLTPTHYGIAGAVVALLLLWRFIVRTREEKRRAMVAHYIMNRGKIRTEVEEEEED